MTPTRPHGIHPFLDRLRFVVQRRDVAARA
jgi:hypothetical protein